MALLTSTKKRSASRVITSFNRPVSKGSLVGLVVDRIKDALIHKELKPGDFLPSENELSRNLGVGKSSIREAIKMLQAMGVVEVRRGQGTVIRKEPGDDLVNSLSFQLILENGSVRDILDLRMMVEPAFTLMAMFRATKEDVRAIETTVENFERSIRENVQRAEDDLAFHLAVLRSTHNPFIIRIGEAVLQLFKVSIGTSMQTIPEVALRDHKRILRAFVKRDEKKLKDAVFKSFDGWKRSLGLDPDDAGELFNSVALENAQ
jgi:GntR family transcriptional repressor for pyruvate dehydrogenase complex